MEIKQEQFDRLNQLDRIEYRQKEIEIKESKPYTFFNDFKFALSAYLLTLLFLITWGLIVPENIYEIQRIANTLKFVFIIPFISLLFDIGKISKRKKLLHELNSKYFKVETKKRK